MKEDNFDRHIFLYAKGWYEKNDIIKDMKVIMGMRCGIDPIHISKENIITILTRIIWDYIRHLHQFEDFVFDLHPGNAWKFGDPRKEKDFNERLIRKCLSILSLQKVVNIPFELGEADPTILPLSELTKKRMEESKNV
jgi:hypothetical protein